MLCCAARPGANMTVAISLRCLICRLWPGEQEYTKATMPFSGSRSYYIDRQDVGQVALCTLVLGWTSICWLFCKVVPFAKRDVVASASLFRRHYIRKVHQKDAGSQVRAINIVLSRCLCFCLCYGE